MSPRHLPWHFGNFIIIPNSSFNIKKYQPFERLLAYGTEVVNLIYTHAACVATAPYSIDEVSAAFDEACLALLDEIAPFLAEVMLGGDVLLPWFGVREIHWVVIAVGIFVGKTTETVSELMHDNRAERLVFGGSESVAVVDASTAVFC